MSMLKNLKSLFIIEEDKPKAKTPQAPPKKAASPKVPPTAKSTAPPPPSGNNRPGQVNKKFSEVLLKALEAADQPGFDYLEFKKALQNLKSLQMDEATRYRSAYAAAQSMGVTPDHLIASADHYLKALAREESNFAAALNKQRTIQVGQQRSEIPKLDKDIAGLEKEIAQLRQRITDAKARKQKLQKASAAAEVKLNNTNNDFAASYGAIVRQIERDKQQMQEFLKSS